MEPEALSDSRRFRVYPLRELVVKAGTLKAKSDPMERPDPRTGNRSYGRIRHQVGR